MNEKLDKETETTSENMDDILRERDKLDKLIRQKFKKELTILFTDICGYTKFMETMGDLAGRSMLQQHNDILFPVIESHNGIIIKTIGDAVMASFQEPLDGVKAAIDIQKGLYEHNRTADASNKIHVKIGVNAGQVLLDKGDLFGDAVNVSARIQAKAGKNEILISKDLYDRICGSEDLLCRYHDSAELKGKAEPIEIYRVIWKDEDVVISEEPKIRAYERKAKKHAVTLYIDATRTGDRLKISASEHIAGQTGTVQQYEEFPIPVEKIQTHCREIVNTLNMTNRKGIATRDTLIKLRVIGQEFSNDLFTETVKKTLQDSTADYLIVDIDDQLVHIPWELLHDGKQFLCQRFSMGRLVRTQQRHKRSEGVRFLERPLRMLIIADPANDLENARLEGSQLSQFMDRNKRMINSVLRTDNVTPEFIRDKIKNFDMVHFAGHADYDPENYAESGWRLSQGIFHAQDIIEMAGAKAMPSFIFSNACQSARTEEWTIREQFQDEIFGMANAFVLSGVKHYVGTFWEILDEPSNRFALEFYRFFTAGASIGEAVRNARQALIREYGEETLVWASYLLYGDPSSNYIEQIQDLPEKKEEALKPEAPEKPEAPVQVRSEPVPPTPAPAAIEQKIEKPSGIGKWIAIAAGILVVLAIGWVAFLKMTATPDTSQYETTAMTDYQHGNYEGALNACNVLEQKNPSLKLIHVIRGNILLSKGELDQAQEAYQKAIASKTGAPAYHSEAWIGLGRIASIRNQPDAALDYYRQASEAEPGNSRGYLSQAMVLNRTGKPEDALRLLETARKIAPDDRSIASIANETRSRVELLKNEEKQAAIDLLVQDLLEQAKQPPRAIPSDGWTSLPLTLCVTDFQTQGYTLREGDPTLLTSGMQDRFLEYDRIELVERAVLDTIMKELKLGSSELADKNSALSLGRLLAARMMLIGKIIYSGPQTQFTARLIETETGRISASVNETFGSAVPLADAAGKLTESLLESIKQKYPLRGKIQKVEADQVYLNIGDRAGVQVGQQFLVVDAGDVLLEVVSAFTDSSVSKIVHGESEILGDMRVQMAEK